MQRGIGVVLSNWNNLKYAVDTIIVEAQGLQIRDKSTCAAIRKAVESLEEKVNEGNRRYQLLLTRIGSNAEASDDGALSVWKAIKALQEESSTLAVAVEKLQALNVAGLAKHSDLMTLNVGLEDFGKHYAESYKNLLDRIVQLEGVRGAPAMPGSISSGIAKGPSLTAFHLLEGQIASLEKISKPGLYLAGTTSGGSSFGGSGGPDVSEVLKTFHNRLKDLEDSRGHRFESSQGNFGSPGEVESMVVDKAVPSCGWYWDLFSILVVSNKEAKTGKDVSDTKYSAERAQQLIISKTDLKGAMTHCLPPCLFGKNGASVSILEAQKVGMQGCPSYSIWIGDGRDSYRDTLTDLLESQIESVRATLDSGSHGAALASWLLDAIILQWASYVQFVDKYYTKLVNVAKFTATNAWKLVG